jgi:NhaP-type Na+/H+ or K+/H+ antiporter
VTNLSFEQWCIIAGGVLLSMALLSTLVKRLPLTTSVIYLALGFLLGPSVIGKTLIHIDPIENASFLHRLAEVVVVVSLFTAGLKMRVSLTWRRWRLPLLLASVAMFITVACLSAVGYYWLQLPLGAAILLGAILAPTDPVLASDVQIRHPRERDALRFSLTGEAGFNDGAAFPFIMLGLGLLGATKEFSYLHWFKIDVVWATVGGLAIGAALGTGVGRFVLYLRRAHKEAVGLDDFLSLSLIALSYGLALELKTYGFLAVFAAGVALRQVEYRYTRRAEAKTDDNTCSAVERAEEEEHLKTGEASATHIATHPAHAPEWMAHAMLQFNEQLDRIGEIVAVILVGVMLASVGIAREVIWLAPLIFLIIRPFSVLVATFGVHNIRHAPDERLLRGYIAWFGVRGIGSLYYLAYSIDHGLDPDLAKKIAAITLSVIAVSIVVHGISVTPFMNKYEEKVEES